MSRLVFDIETNGLLDQLDRLHCLVAYDLDREELFSYTPDTLRDGLRKLQEADVLIGHNIISFDLPALRKVYPDFQLKDGCILRDTLNISRLIWTEIKASDFGRHKSGSMPAGMIGRHSLEAWGYRMKLFKDDFGKTTDWSEWTPQMQEYCEQDVRVNTKLWEVIEKKNYSEQAIQLEMDFQEIITQQEAWGFAFDVEKARHLYAHLSKKRAELTDQLREVFPPRVVKMKVPAYFTFRDDTQDRYSTKKEAEDRARQRAKKRKDTIKNQKALIVPGPPKKKHIPFNPGSRMDIAKRWIESYGWKPTEYTAGGEPQLSDEVLETLKFPEAPLIREYLTVSKRIGQLAEGKGGWLKKVQDDGRIYGRMITNQCVTGRCSHIDPNIGQVPRVGSDYGEECRELFIVETDNGYVLVGCDASGLELRCLGHYLARYDGGAYAREVIEGDVHTLNQKAAGLPTRAEAKTFISIPRDA